MTTIDASTYQQRMSEAQMESSIRGAIGERGLVFHIRDSRSTPEMQGFPDLVLILPEKNMVMFVELKSQKRRVTDEQQAVMAAIGECSEVRSYLVRPKPHEGEISFDQLMEVLA